MSNYLCEIQKSSLLNSASLKCASDRHLASANYHSIPIPCRVPCTIFQVPIAHNRVDIESDLVIWRTLFRLNKEIGFICL